MLSPNRAWSGASAAGAMRIRLGGTQDCFGKPVEKPKTGDHDRLAERGDIGRANRLLYAANADDGRNRRDHAVYMEKEVRDERAS